MNKINHVISNAPTLRGELKSNFPLARFTSWRVGGLAERLYLPADREDLSCYIASLPSSTPITWLGLGSNTLIRDMGIAGTVIITQGKLNKLERIDHLLIRAEAGVSCATLARYCARLELSGLEFLAGIPGTVGGALAMNAGCCGSETWEFVKHVETLDRNGQFHTRSPSDYQIAYRSVEGRAEEYFTVGYFQLTPSKKEQGLEKIKQLLDHRAQTQPINEFNCGSVFRNPTDDYAGRLIEAAGLKGARIGGAYVSEKHANFIINDGTATALDIENVITQVAETVFVKSGIQLIREVRILGGKS